MDREYIKNLILETIVTNIRSSKREIIKESKDFGFSLEEILQENEKHEYGMVGHYLVTMDVYELLSSGLDTVMPEMKKTVNETPHEFANRIFPLWNSIISKKYKETASTRNASLKPVYDLIDGYLLEAVKYSIVESIAECNFNHVYDGSPCLFQPDEESYKTAREEAEATNYFDDIASSTFAILRDAKHYYQTRYTYVGSEEGEPWGPNSRISETWSMSPYREFLNSNKKLLLKGKENWFSDII